MAIRKGIPCVWGVKPLRPIVNVPPAALRVRVRMRPMDVAKAYVKYPDRIEQWALGPTGDTMQNIDKEWELKLLLGTNAARKLAP